MTLQDLLGGIDLARCRLVRHNLSKESVARNHARGYIEIYQAIQLPTRLKGCDYVFSFLGTEGTNGVYLGCYRIVGSSPFNTDTLPADFILQDGDKDIEKCLYWVLEPTDILSDLKNRLVIEWGKGALSWCQNGTNEKEILCIRPKSSEVEFSSYDRVILSYKALRNIVANSKAHREWEDRLSAVAGVYLITDTKTGQHYVGSASGEIGGIWGRWSDYAKTKHGGNKRLIELMKKDEHYCDNFQFSILEVFPIKRDRHEVLVCEQLYKQKLRSITFGLNDN